MSPKQSMEPKGATSCELLCVRVVPAGIMSFPGPQHSCCTVHPKVSITLWHKWEHLGEKQRKCHATRESFLLEYLFLFIIPNGERHLMVSRAQYLDKNRVQGGGVTISVNEKPGYTAGAVGHLAQHLARANGLSCTGISTSNTQFCSLSSTVN